MTDEATQAEDYRYLFGIAQQLGYPSVLEALEAIPAADEITRLNAENERARNDALEEAAQMADKWRDENKASASKARMSLSVGAQNMAEMLDGAAIECNAIAGAIRALITKASRDSGHG